MLSWRCSALSLIGLALCVLACGPAPKEPSTTDSGPAPAAGPAPSNESASPSRSTASQTTPVPVGQRIQQGVVASVRGQPADMGWLAPGSTTAPLGDCRSSSVSVVRRFESETEVVIEAVAEFEGPREGGAFVVWASLDSSDRAGTIVAVGDSVWAARCLKRCHRSEGCPAARLVEPQVSVGPAQVMAGGDARRAELDRAYRRWVTLTAKSGGYERWVTPDAVLIDMTSGRRRFGIEGLAEGLQAVARHYRDPHTIEGLRLAVFGDTVVAAFSWAARDGQGRVARRLMAEVVTFDEQARVTMSRGYAMSVGSK